MKKTAILSAVAVSKKRRYNLFPLLIALGNFAACSLLICMGCFSTWEGDKDAGTVTVGLGPSGGDGGVAVPWAPDIVGHELTSDDLTHTITLSGGPGPKQTLTVKGSRTVTFTVTPGRWNILVEAKDDNGTLIAVGTAPGGMNIKPGKNPLVRITMGPPPDTRNTGPVFVTDITGIPTAVTAGTSQLLIGMVVPNTATYQTIVWNVVSAGDTGATIADGTNILDTQSAGTVRVRATIANGKAQGTDYTKDFPITVNGKFVAVESLTILQDTATARTPLTLTAIVEPDTANQTIVWSVTNQGTTGATIDTGTNILNTTAAGTVTVMATIADGAAQGTDYTQDFDITVTLPALTGTVSITGNAVVGYRLTADTSELKGSGTIFYQWERILADGTTTTNIGTNSTYVVQTADLGCTITVTVTRDGYDGSSSASTAEVTPPFFSITFPSIGDAPPSITGPDPIVSRSGVGWPGIVTLWVVDADQYDSIEWSIAGTTGSGASFTLDAYNIANVGVHLLIVEVWKDSKLYSMTVEFEIKP
jgi:hypothetical protein